MPFIAGPCIELQGVPPSYALSDHASPKKVYSDTLPSVPHRTDEVGETTVAKRAPIDIAVVEGANSAPARIDSYLQLTKTTRARLRQRAELSRCRGGADRVSSLHGQDPGGRHPNRLERRPGQLFDHRCDRDTRIAGRQAQPSPSQNSPFDRAIPRNRRLGRHALRLPIRPAAASHAGPRTAQLPGHRSRGHAQASGHDGVLVPNAAHREHLASPAETGCATLS